MEAADGCRRSGEKNTRNREAAALRGKEDLKCYQPTGGRRENFSKGAA